MISIYLSTTLYFSSEFKRYISNSLVLVFLGLLSRDWIAHLGGGAQDGWQGAPMHEFREFGRGAQLAARLQGGDLLGLAALPVHHRVWVLLLYLLPAEVCATLRQVGGTVEPGAHAVPRQVLRYSQACIDTTNKVMKCRCKTVTRR